tara:strand:- start:1040 stop:1378 length:339 start_codon:yes stop_codon:yes gene_type:complete
MQETLETPVTPVVTPAVEAQAPANTTSVSSANLTFRRQITVADFKAMHNNNAIEVIENPHTGKLFFLCGSVSGKVAREGYGNNPVISEVVTDEGEIFYMLHKKQSNNVKAVL